MLVSNVDCSLKYFVIHIFRPEISRKIIENIFCFVISQNLFVLSSKRKQLNLGMGQTNTTFLIRTWDSRFKTICQCVGYSFKLFPYLKQYSKHQTNVLNACLFQNCVSIRSNGIWFLFYPFRSMGWTFSSVGFATAAKTVRKINKKTNFILFLSEDIGQVSISTDSDTFSSGYINSRPFSN
jgi:hypothetical protein